MPQKTERGPSKGNALPAKTRKKKTYVLRLYVAGVTPRSQEAIRKVKAVCDAHLAGCYDLEVIDLYQQPEAAKREQIIAAPTLIKQLPLPLRRLIGSMAEEDKLLVGLDLLPERGDPKAGSSKKG